MEFQGIAASQGYAIGTAYVLQQQEAHVTTYGIAQEHTEAEIQRLDDAVRHVIGDIEQLRDLTRAKIGDAEAEVFSAHIMALQDPEFMRAIKERVRSEHINVEAAVQVETDQFLALFAAIDNEYIRERAADLRDVSQRLLRCLLGIQDKHVTNMGAKVILFAHDLSPSDTAKLDRHTVVGIATNVGGRTTHTAIMARSLEIPAVVGLKDIVGKVCSGDIVIVDGNLGKVYINPPETLLQQYREKETNFTTQQNELKKLLDEPSITSDGVCVELAANIGNPEDGKGALANGAEGVGLYRTEFLYMGRDTLPSEEEQFEAYKAVALMFGKARPVVIRTLDIGGDKELLCMSMPCEMDPFLGYRAIRLCLDQEVIFKTQLRAILRASVYGNIKMMYPMIATLQELRAANQLLEGIKKDLTQEGIAFNEQMEVGIMVEIPSVAVLAHRFAKEVDFFSIGTNDLIQYTMAADRMNEKVAYLYQPFNPTVLHLIRNVIEAAHAEGKKVAMCGEMAGELLAVPVLLGMGLDEFSMSASSILPVRQLVRQMSQQEAKRITQAVMEMDDAESIKQYIAKELSLLGQLS